MMQLIHVMRLTYTIKENEPIASGHSTGKAVEKVVVISVEDNTENSGSVDDYRRNLYC